MPALRAAASAAFSELWLEASFPSVRSTSTRARSFSVLSIRVATATAS